MANLSALLKSKKITGDHDSTGLERGKIYIFTPNLQYFPCVCQRGNGGIAQCHFCWTSPASGRAVVEIWGAAGSGGEMCCCGSGVPGNPGAYVRKTLDVNANSMICGFVGQSCANNSLCWRGCSEYSGVCYDTARCAGCLCAMGGRSGWAFCNTSNANCTPLQRFVRCCFAHTVTNAGCGYVCNYTDIDCCVESNCAADGRLGGCFLADFWMACGYGGDINCCGGFSCVYMGHCNACCYCCRVGYLKIAPQIFTECGSVIPVQHANGFVNNNQSGHYVTSLYHSLSGLTRAPAHGVPMAYCWGAVSYCGCYENMGINSFLGTGVPGMSASICSPCVRDHTMRGGMGAVRIQFIAK